MVVFVALAGLVQAGEVEGVLKGLPAPAQEYERVPAKYVIQRLEKTARRSGDPALAGFVIEPRKAGIASERISLNLENMTLHQALNALATATGTSLSFEGGRAILSDTATVAVDQPEEPKAADDGNDGEYVEVTFVDIDDALVFVETGVGRGSAFVAEMGGQWYIFSNQHNFLGANKLDLRAMHGGLLKFNSFEYCKNRDLVRFELEPGQEEGLLALKFAETTPGIGEGISIYGNSAGGNVATELKGKILGVGPRDVEVDADIVPGNSGSPILDEKGEVVGVATYISFAPDFKNDDLRKESFKGTRFGKARRYGVRVPNEGWAEVSMQPFLSQTYRLADTKNYLELLQILTEYWSGNDDYEEAAYMIMSSFASRGRRVKPPYEFHSTDMEEEIRMFVKSFKRNYEEFVTIAQEMDKQDLAKLSNQGNRKSEGRVDRIDYHLRTMLLGKARQLQDDMAKYNWMTQLLSELAEPLDEMAGELVRKLEGETNIYDRVKAVR